MRALLLVGLISLLVACGSGSQNPVSSNGDLAGPEQPAALPAPAPPPVAGVDISKYQGTVDFKQLKEAGHHFVYVKASQGVDYQDPDFLVNLAGARAAGLTIGVYHFYMTNDDPRQQFVNHLNTVQLQPGDLPPVVDIESLARNSRPDLAGDLQQFLNFLENHYGVKPIIYTGRNFANQHLTGFGDYPLWLAEYGVEEPQLPEGWQDWTFWQHTQAGTVPGISGEVDIDRFHGGPQDLGALLIKEK